jgi:serine/threonine protein kinase
MHCCGDDNRLVKLSVLLSFFSGALPFSEYENPMTAMYQIANGKSPPIGNHITVSDNVTSFISACCAVDPMQRHSVELLLTHPFVNQPYSDDNTQIIIPDGEDCTDSDLPSITEEVREIPSPSKLSPSPNTEQQPMKKIGNPEKGELTFKSRIPILQNRAIKVNVDSPDYPVKKSMEEQVTPSIYRPRKTRELSTNPSPNIVQAPSPNIIQAPILTPTPPAGVKTNASTKFRKQTSRGQVTGTSNESDSNKSVTQKSPMQSPVHHFSDQELSPVNHTHFSPSQSILRETSVPQLQSIESLKNDFGQTSSPVKQPMEPHDVQSNSDPNPIIQEVGSNSQAIEESLNYTYSEDFECEPCVTDRVAINAKTPEKEIQQQSVSGSREETELKASISPPQNSVYSPVSKVQQLNHESPDNKNLKKNPRFNSKSAPNREKSDFLDESDDNVSAILINGSLMNSRGSLIEVFYLQLLTLPPHFSP